MASFIDTINISISLSGIVVSILGFTISYVIRNIDNLIKRFFMFLFSCLFLYSICNFLNYTSLIFLGPEYTIFSKVTLFFESLFSSILMPLLTMIILYFAEEHMRGILFYTVLTYWIIYVILLIIAQFTKLIYYFEDDNTYHRGPFYSVLLAPTVLIMATLLIGLIRRKNKLSKKIYTALLLYIIIPAVSMIIQMFLYGVYFIIIGTVAASIIMFLILITEQIQIIIDQQQEINRQQANILVLQMRPHFIYNTLSSIYYLCVLDPKKAQKTVGDFNTYLRKNLNAIARNELIAFTEELEHTKAYLAVEKVRYEKLLFIDYDTPVTAFSLPPLTLQPIVENAVKYGVDPELPPLHILVKTRQDSDKIILTVEDTGPGYSPIPSDDERVHLGIENVRKRISMMCDGTLDIKAGSEGGTTITITFPRS